VPQPSTSGSRPVNAHGEVLEAGLVPDCYLDLLLPPPQAGEPEAGTVLIVAPAVLLHPRVPQPAGSLIYELLTGHPERQAGELVFMVDLTGELRAWPTDTWAKLGVDPDQVIQAVIDCWHAGELSGLQVDDLSFEEARSLTQPLLKASSAGGRPGRSPALLSLSASGRLERPCSCDGPRSALLRKARILPRLTYVHCRW
jgi:hypothetical protein